ncbi:MAG TPA: NAD(P)/FAD-dependent oxidoreductase, partial [Gemmatimonadota bacterium]|nr:NAD(P)/FAD-dependent oxidoreductase [Gemmatimonadota bacterium]
RDVAERIVHIHRSDRYRAHDHTVGLVETAAEKGEIDLLTFHEVEAIHGDERITGATIYDNRTEERKELGIDDVLALIGFVPNIGPIAEWGIELEGNTIRVNSRMETNVPGIYAAGDIAMYDGKLELISTGFGEAAIAVNYAVHHARPDQKVSPGHSTSSAAFRDR